MECLNNIVKVAKDNPVIRKPDWQVGEPHAHQGARYSEQEE